MDEFVKNNQNKNIPRTFVNIPITVLSKDEYLTKQLEELKEDRFGSSCVENRTVIPIKIRDVESTSSSYQKNKSNNYSLSFQPTAAKPPSGCRTLPVPRKSYGNFNARKSETGLGQLPFGGGFDLQIIESELQVNASNIDNITFLLHIF